MRPSPAPRRISQAKNRTSTIRGINLRTTFQQIRELIVRGRLAPGSRIVEVELASRLGVSRTPVRGALNWLQREGYVISTSGDGSKSRLAVAPLTKEDALELYQIVGHVEGMAARKTAQLETNARALVVRQLQGLNERLRGLAEKGKGDPNCIFELDINFHQTIVETGAGPRLLALHSATKPQTERYWRLYASAILDQLATSVGEHEEIICAIDSGNSDQAERAVQVNWENGAARLFKVIDTLGERGSW